MTSNRVLIVGASASGKTTFARKLASKYGLPLILMDEIMWNPGWVYIGDDEVKRKLSEISQKDQWLVEGYINKYKLSELMMRADCIIYLDYPGGLIVWRYIKRWFKHRKEPRPELPGSPESFSFDFLYRVFLKKELWHFENVLKSHPELLDKVVRLSSPKEADNYLGNI